MAACSAIQPIRRRFDIESAIKPLDVASGLDGRLTLDGDAARGA